MRAFVIAIGGNVKSQESAERCIASGKKYGIEVEKMAAITPRNNVDEICKNAGIVNTDKFTDQYSKRDNCIACFLSHYTLWSTCVSLNEPIAIFEHDAVITAPLPSAPPNFCGNIGKPSFGKFNTPATIGWGGLVSKPYFPGCHAYIVTPTGAKLLKKRARREAGPADVFLHISRFGWLQEYYPYCAYADDSFSTVQTQRGTLAKHNNSDDYELIDA